VTLDVRLIAEKRETRFELKRDDLHRAGFEVNRTRARKIRNEWETVAARICALVTTELQEERIKREKEREREREKESKKGRKTGGDGGALERALFIAQETVKREQKDLLLARLSTESKHSRARGCRERKELVLHRRIIVYISLSFSGASSSRVPPAVRSGPSRAQNRVYRFVSGDAFVSSSRLR